jgi:hypothetical protein
MSEILSTNNGFISSLLVPHRVLLGLLKQWVNIINDFHSISVNIAKIKRWKKTTKTMTMAEGRKIPKNYV